MPSGERSSRQQTNRNTIQLQRRSPVQANVVATPRSTFVVPDTKLNRLASAVNAISPGLQTFLAEEHAKFVHDEQVRAQADASKRGPIFNNDELNKILSDAQSPFYQQAFAEMSGKVAALDQSRQLNELYETGFDKENGDIELFLREFSEQARADIDDVDFTNGFTQAFEQAKQSLRNRHLEFGVNKAKEERDTNIFSLIKESADRLSSNGQELTTDELQLFYNDAKSAFNMPFSEVDALAFEAVKESALENGDPNILNVFDQRKPDGTPGLADNPKFAERIRNVKAQAKRLQDGKAAKVDQLAKFQWRKAVQNRMTSGDFITDDEFDAAVASGLTTPDAAASARQKQIDIAIDRQERSEILNAIATNDMGTLAVKGDDSRIKEEFDNWAVETLQESQGLDGIQQVVERGSDLGLSYRPWANTLANVNPSNEETFMQAATLWQNIQASNPIYAEKLVPEKQSAVFQTFWDAQILAGLDEQQALVAAIKLSSGDLVGGGQEFLQTRDAISQINDVTSGLLENGFRQDAVNETFVRDSIKRLARFSLSFGQSDPDSAISWAEQRFRGTHTVVNGRWVPTGSLPLPADITKASVWLSDQIKEKRRLDGKDVDEEGYFIQSDPRTLIDGKWGIYQESNDVVTEMPRIDPRDVVRQFHKATLPTRDDIEAERQRLIKKEQKEREDFTVGDQQLSTLNAL